VRGVQPPQHGTQARGRARLAAARPKGACDIGAEQRPVVHREEREHALAAERQIPACPVVGEREATLELQARALLGR